MEKELNIAAILKEKPKYTKLYSPLYGEVFLNRIVSTDGIRVLCKNIDGLFGTDEKSFWKNGKFTLAGEVCLFPSKGMQDWSKFAWKKGDILTNIENDFHIVFDHFENDEYTLFCGKYAYDEEDAEWDASVDSVKTEKFNKANNDVVISHLRDIEEHYGGKLNLSTLQIGQPKQEFKDGDVVYSEGTEHEVSSIFIVQDMGNYLSAYILLREDNQLAISENSLGLGLIDSKMRLATDSEKQQLIDALAKENKAWDADKKMLVDLPKKCEFKPMDFYLAKYNNSKNAIWFLYQYAFTNKDGYICNINDGCIEAKKYTILPYNNSTKHLLGTTDEWKGGEG